MAIDNTELNLVAVGASAGGVEALTDFAAGLPADLPYAVLVVLHIPASAPSVLARIIARSGPLPAAQAVDGEQLQPGTIRVAPPDRHLLVTGHRIVLSEGPTENGYRPAINSLFRSVALESGPRAVGVLLSGVLDDGTLGMAAIRSRGGTTVAQTPSAAMFSAMPRSAIEAGVVDHQSDATDIGGLLARLAQRPLKEIPMEPDPAMELENQIAMARRFSVDVDSEALGPPSGYTCPDCNGSLVAVGDGNYRCRVGHAWTADSLLRARDDEIENAMWIAIRSLQEKAKLARRLSERVKPATLSQKYQSIAEEAEQALKVLGERLTNVQSGQVAADD